MKHFLWAMLVTVVAGVSIAFLLVTISDRRQPRPMTYEEIQAATKVCRDLGLGSVPSSNRGGQINAVRCGKTY